MHQQNPTSEHNAALKSLTADEKVEILKTLSPRNLRNLNDTLEQQAQDLRYVDTWNPPHNCSDLHDQAASLHGVVQSIMQRASSLLDISSLKHDEVKKKEGES